jgi:hypothetical protein
MWKSVYVCGKQEPVTDCTTELLNLAAISHTHDHPKAHHVDRQVQRCHMPGCATALPSNDISSGRTINYMRLSVNEMQTSSGQLVMQKGSHASPSRGTFVSASLFLNLFNDTFSVAWVMRQRIFPNDTLKTRGQTVVLP